MDFEEQIKRGYRKGISDRGDCPASDDLIRYQQRELSTEEMLRIKQHVDVCGFCDCAVAELSEFDSVASFAAREPEAAGRKGFFSRFLLHPAFAYGIALALLYPAYRGLFHPGPAPEKIVERTGSAMDFDLGQGSVTRSPSYGKEAGVVLSPDERFFILTLFVPVRSDHRYKMEIRNEQGLLVDSGTIRSRDSVGNFSIVATSSLFPDGRYRLTVQEIEAATGRVKEDHQFLFRVVRKRA